MCDLSLGANPASPSLSSLTHMLPLHLSMWILAQGMMLTPICSASPLVPTLVPDDGFVTMKVSADHVPPHRFRRDSFSDMVRWLEGPKMGECMPVYYAWLLVELEVLHLLLESILNEWSPCRACVCVSVCEQVMPQPTTMSTRQDPSRYSLLSV